MKISAKKVFKEKTSVKKELEKALINKTPVSYSILAKLVGISIYRVRKYCENHFIDLHNYKIENLSNMKKTPKTQKKKTNKKLHLDTPKPNKINLKPPKPINLDN